MQYDEDDFPPCTGKKGKTKTKFVFVQHLYCTVCLDFFQKPRILPCGHTYCQSCIDGLLGRKKTASCPQCRSQFTKQGPLKSAPNVVLARILDDIVVRCKFKNCRWTGRRCEADKHVRECQFNPENVPSWLATQDNKIAQIASASCNSPDAGTPPAKRQRTITEDDFIKPDPTLPSPSPTPIPTDSTPLEENKESSPDEPLAPPVPRDKWACTICTYHNDWPDDSCMMCNTPKPADLQPPPPVEEPPATEEDDHSESDGDLYVPPVQDEDSSSDSSSSGLGVSLRRRLYNKDTRSRDLLTSLMEGSKSVHTSG